jgi:hypothetical protein
MEAITKIVISKSFPANSNATKEAREGLPVGTHKVDTTVHIQGELEVQEDYKKTPTSTILNEEFLSLVLHHAGVTRKSAVEAISKIADEYMDSWAGKGESGKEAKKLRKEKVKEFDPEGNVAKAIKGIKDRLPKVPCKGSVSFSGSLVQVEASEDLGVEPDVTSDYPEMGEVVEMPLGVPIAQE